MDKAIIKITGELLDIKLTFVEYQVNVINTDDEFKGSSSMAYNSYVKIEKNEKRVKYFGLSNGNRYHEDELVIGLDEIRDYKIENYINESNLH